MVGGEGGASVEGPDAMARARASKKMLVYF